MLVIAYTCAFSHWTCELIISFFLALVKCTPIVSDNCTTLYVTECKSPSAVSDQSVLYCLSLYSYLYLIFVCQKASPEFETFTLWFVLLAPLFLVSLKALTLSPCDITRSTDISSTIWLCRLRTSFFISFLDVLKVKREQNCREATVTAGAQTVIENQKNKTFMRILWPNTNYHSSYYYNVSPEEGNRRRCWKVYCLSIKMARITSGFIIKSWLRPVEVPSSCQTKPQKQKTIKKESLSSILRGYENHVRAEPRHLSSDRQEARDVLGSYAPS